MSVVVDASVALKWIIEEAGSEDAEKILAEGGLYAPALWKSEIANSLWKLVRRGEFTAEQARDRLTFLLDEVNVEFVELTNAEFDRALARAVALDHPVYDCMYLIAAEKIDGTVVTADRRFASVAAKDRKSKGRIRLLGA